MKDLPNNTKLYGIMILYDMQTDFFKRVLKGIEDKDLLKRLGTEANHSSWIAGSVVSGRYYLGKCFNLEVESSTGKLFENNQGIIDNAIYPTLVEYENDWDKISPLLRDALMLASAEKLNEKIEMPGMEMTLFDMIIFTSYREANCIGQIALWRRLLGYKAMSYM